MRSKRRHRLAHERKSATRWRHYTRNSHCGGSSRRLTKRPHKVVFGPQRQHGQVKVDDLKVEGRGADEVVVNGALHGEELAQRQIHKERDGTGGQFGDDRVLARDEKKHSTRLVTKHVRALQTNHVFSASMSSYIEHPLYV